MIGNLTPALISYLAFTSRKLYDPLHLVYMGSSGSGKTHVQANISSLMPPEDVIDVTALSDKALYYFGERELSHKLLTLEDLSGVSEQVLYPLRELQSKQKLSNISPQKDRHDRLDNATKVVYGPVATSVCTTWEQLYEDNANRSLPLWIDSHPAHNQSVMDYQRRLAAGQIDLARQRAVVESHQNLQRLLKVVRVLNPFAPQITLPPSVDKPLRSQRLLLACIEAMTCLHQYQREQRSVNGMDYMVSTKEDNILTLRLLAPVLLHKSDELTPASRRFFERLKTWLEARGQTTFYGPQVRKALKIKPTTINRYLGELKSYGLLTLESNSRKQGYAYSIPHWNEYTALSAQLQEHLNQVIDHINTLEEVLPMTATPVASTQNGAATQ